MKRDKRQRVLREDYMPPAYLVDAVDLDCDIRAGETVVTAHLTLRRNLTAPSDAPLVLDGDELQTLAVSLDGLPLSAARYTLTDTELKIAEVPDRFELGIVIRILPDSNTRLSGLYRSTNGYFTQCEAQGFRRITWFPDRPDVMSRYSVTIHANRCKFPILLSNGNPMGEGDEIGADGEQRHWAKWEDPFPKPCYLFALVAARLEVLRDNYTTRSGRKVQLAIYVQPGKVDQCGHAMAALKKAMRWDEEVFELECDLEQYMIVAVGDFNMGAMENKGLNIFNAKYVLARRDVATDTDYQDIERVIAHEYFHNWTGNRVTLRDWFQLSLKEGLTVYRDQEFGADVHNASVSHIRDVRALRATQFPEDAGPMAHPVRPASYMEINNFYTATVYQKGAQVVRMLSTLVGKETFHRGMDAYFARYDGQAVTCDDFVAIMADASAMDFSQFMRWYDQMGTPRVVAAGHYDPAAQRYSLRLTQSCPGMNKNLPFHIPVRVGLVGPDGMDLPLHVIGKTAGMDQSVLSLTEAEQDFAFENVIVPPVPSLLRGFTAPVVLEFPYSDKELMHLMTHDSDPFNRWEASQRLTSQLILEATSTLSAGYAPQWPSGLARATARILAQDDEDPAFTTEMLTMPSEATLAEQVAVVDPDALHAARNGLRGYLAEQLAREFRNVYDRLAPDGSYHYDTAAVGRRALRNLCLGYLAEPDAPAARALVMSQFESADNMTDQFAALSLLAQSEGPERQQALAGFYHRWQNESLVLDKWLLVQATSRRSCTLQDVTRLLDHPAFELGNPNKAYALLRGFGINHVRFHAADGSGYRFLAEQILRLDAINPQVAARVGRCFDRWRKFDAGRQSHARAALERLLAHHGLSRDVGEIVERALA